MNSIKEAFQSLSPKQSDIIVGVVTKTAPLTVKAIGDEKLIVKPLYGQSVRKMTLEIGDEVLMLAYREGKKYFILDRR